MEATAKAGATMQKHQTLGGFPNRNTHSADIGLLAEQRMRRIRLAIPDASHTSGTGFQEARVESASFIQTFRWVSGVFQYRITGRTPVNFGVIEHQIENHRHQFAE